MKQYVQIDAYGVLGLSHEATEAEIRLAYHRKVKEEQHSDVLGRAYELIKDGKARARYSCNSVYSYFSPLKESSREDLNLDEIISEVAFLSDWEIEEIDGN